MADVRPLRALHYDLGVVGPLDGVLAPPYDVIDPEQRTRLAARSPHNVVAIDLPRAPLGGDPYEEAARLLRAWRREGAVVRDAEPALWVLRQDFTGPDGVAHTREGVLARVRVGDPGIRPHERTHPGPKEDRLRLTRATEANLSPIFSLFDDPEGAVHAALAPHAAGDPWGQATDAEGTTHRLWRVADGGALARVTGALRDRELLIADGHHRYETARAYAQEAGDEGDSGYVLMCLVALQDPGLAVFPTHRLVRFDRSVGRLLDAYLHRCFHVTDVAPEDLRPPDGDGPLTMGWLDRRSGRARRVTLKDQGVADRALPDRPPAYRRLDTAVLETLVLGDVLGMDEEDVAHLRGLGYSRTDDEARALIADGSFDAAFFLRATPVRQVQEIAAAGLTMPPKSTFFFPKIPTGLLFNPLRGAL